MKAISKQTKYVLTPQELTNLVTEAIAAKGFASAGEKVDVTYQVSDTSDDRFNGGYPSYGLTKIEITVNHK